MSTATAAHPRRRARRGEGELLRGEILTAAKDLLRETGDADAVSVRSVADRVGVSTPSIYLHFTDKAALIDAVCEDVFAELDRLMEEAARDEPDPFDSLHARGLAYVRFALANPEHYRIVMMRLPHEGSTFTSEDATGSATYRHLVEGVRRCMEVGVFADTADAEDIATSLWAATHGAISLVLSKPGMTDDPVTLCDQVLSACAVGLAVCSYTSGDPKDTAALVEGLRAGR